MPYLEYQSQAFHTPGSDCPTWGDRHIHSELYLAKDSRPSKIHDSMTFLLEKSCRESSSKKTKLLSFQLRVAPDGHAGSVRFDKPVSSVRLELPVELTMLG